MNRNMARNTAAAVHAHSSGNTAAVCGNCCTRQPAAAIYRSSTLYHHQSRWQTKHEGQFRISSSSSKQQQQLASAAGDRQHRLVMMTIPRTAMLFNTMCLGSGAHCMHAANTSEISQQTHVSLSNSSNRVNQPGYRRDNRHSSSFRFDDCCM